MEPSIFRSIWYWSLVVMNHSFCRRRTYISAWRVLRPSRYSECVYCSKVYSASFTYFFLSICALYSHSI